MDIIFEKLMGGAGGKDGNELALCLFPNSQGFSYYKVHLCKGPFFLDVKSGI